MKKIIILSFILFNLSVHAQLNNRFYSGGSAYMVQSTGAYCSNTFRAWRDIQEFRTSQYYWHYTDSVIKANQTAGLRTMITLKCTNPKSPYDTIHGTPAWCFDQNQTSDNASAWFPQGTDTTLWKIFVDSIVERYDGNGTHDMPGLTFPITQWHIIGQEWQRIWSSDQYLDTTCSFLTQDTSLTNTKKFVQLVNMTYNVIKNRQPNSEISFAGIDRRNQSEAFYDGYFTGQTNLCTSKNCIIQNNYNASQFASQPGFLKSRRNVMYILKNSKADEIDVHEYGNWENIPDVVRWVKDSALCKNVIFMEGGGPFCQACDTLYHSVSDMDGRLPAPLVRDNASYVVYYFITGLASGVKKLHWHVGPEYTPWGPIWGDLDLLSKNDISKPSAYVYRWLAKTLFSNSSADTVIHITDTLNINLYHYQVQQLPTFAPFIDVAWSTNPTDNIVINGTGTLYTWDIPTTCNSLYPTACDSVFPMNTFSVSGSHTIALNNGIPVFYSWNNVLTVAENINNKNNLSVNVYPNPFSETTVLEIANWKNQNYELKIYDLFGREIKKYQIINQKTEISRGDLPSGMYFYYVKSENKNIGTGKIIIE